MRHAFFIELPLTIILLIFEREIKEKNYPAPKPPSLWPLGSKKQFQNDSTLSGWWCILFPHPGHEEAYEKQKGGCCE